MRIRASARRLWLTLHLYIGLASGGIVALLGITGSVLVFYLELDGLLNPAIRVEQAVPLPSPDAILHTLQARHPGRGGPWRIEMPLAAGEPILVRYYNPPETSGRSFAPLMLSLDPRTLDETSHRFWGEYLTTWIYDLHYTLLMGEPGRQAVGIIGLAMLVSLLSGLYLWWPSRTRLAAALRLTIRRGAVRATYDLHVLPGVYAFIVLATLALTGSVLALPDTARNLVATFSPLTPPFPPPSGLLRAGQAALSLDAAADVARQRFPGAELRWIETSGRSGTPISIRVHQAGEPGRRFPRSQVWIDPGTGAVLATRDPRSNSAGDHFMDWMHPLHNGEAFGIGGRLLACAGGLVPTLLLITGWMRWRQKVGARRAARAQHRV